MIAGRILWCHEPSFPARRIGKIVPYLDNLVYVYDQPAVYRRLQAYGVAETVLVEMLRGDVRLVHYIVDGDTYMTQRDDVLAQGVWDTAWGARKGYVYMPLKCWQIHRGRLSYPWVPETQRLELPWVVEAPELAMWRRKLEAARPKEPMQMGLWA